MHFTVVVFLTFIIDIAIGIDLFRGRFKDFLYNNILEIIPLISTTAHIIRQVSDNKNSISLET